jgi:flagellar motility protein MotE (MotC chaperone)
MKFLAHFILIFKRMKLSTQILLAVLIALKLVFGSVLFYRVGIDSVFIEKSAVASEIQNRTADTPEGDVPAEETQKIDLDFLIRKKAALGKEEKRLVKKEAELMAIQQEINNKIASLTRLRNEIRAEMEKKRTAEAQKYKHLIKVYSAMKPQNAAGLIEKLDKSLAIELLSKMKGEDVGKILSYVDLEKAAIISEGLVKKE